MPNATSLGAWLQAVVDKLSWESVVRQLFRHCPSERLTSVLQELCESRNSFRELDTSRAFQPSGVSIGDEAATNGNAPPSAPGSLLAGRKRPLSADVQSPVVFKYQEW